MQDVLSLSVSLFTDIAQILFLLHMATFDNPW